jgi:hypothetical protein
MKNKLRDGLIGLGLLAFVSCNVLRDNYGDNYGDNYDQILQSSEGDTAVVHDIYYTSHTTGGLFSPMSTYYTSHQGQKYIIANHGDNKSLLWIGDFDGRCALTDSTGDLIPDIYWRSKILPRVGDIGGTFTPNQDQIELFQKMVDNSPKNMKSIWQP